MEEPGYAPAPSRPALAAEDEDDVRVYVPPVKKTVLPASEKEELPPASVKEPPKVVVGPVVHPVPPMPKTTRPRPLPAEDAARTRVMPAAPPVPLRPRTVRGSSGRGTAASG